MTVEVTQQGRHEHPSAQYMLRRFCPALYCYVVNVRLGLAGAIVGVRVTVRGGSGSVGVRVRHIIEF